MPLVANSTIADAGDASVAERSRNLRRIGLTLFALPVLAAALGVFGPNAGHVSATGSAYRLGVDYPRATRSSIVTPLVVTVTRPGGFGDDPVIVAVDQGFLDRLDFQNWYPNPSAESNDGDITIYEFDPPDGDTLRVSLDARTGPNQGYSHNTYAVAVLTDAHTPAARVTFRTIFWP